MAINEHDSPGEIERDPEFSQADLPRVISELKNEVERLGAANRELTDKEELLRLSVETGRVGVWVWDTVGSVHSLGWSDRLKEIFGLPRGGDVTRELFLKCVHPEDRERIDWAIMQALSGVNQGFYNVEYRIVHPANNSIHWVTAQGQAFFNTSGQSIRFIGAVVDISDRKQVEEFTARLNLELESRISERVRALETINKTLETEVRERINLEQQLRESQAYLAESQQLARGQLDTLREIVNSIAAERNPDMLLQHVLSAIAKQMGGESLSVFKCDEDNSFTLEVVYENGRIKFPTQDANLPTYDQPLWREYVEKGTECLVTEFDRDPIWLRFVNRANHAGVPRLNEESPPAIVDEHARIKARGVILSLAIPMVTSGRVSGSIEIRYKKRREFLPEEIELSLALAQHAALALHIMRLSRVSRQTAIVNERNRLARDIHDTLAQGFTGIIAQLRAARGATDLVEAAMHMERAENLARSSLDEARRSVRTLRPRSLEVTPLGTALESTLKTMTTDSGLKATFEVDGERRSISPEWQDELLRIAKEFLTNTIRHAHAANFHCKLSFSAEFIGLTLTDDGCGFDTHAEREGFGLLGMKERVDQMDGKFLINSQLGRGTEIVISVPYQPQTEPSEDKAS